MNFQVPKEAASLWITNVTDRANYCGSQASSLPKLALQREPHDVPKGELCILWASFLPSFLDRLFLDKSDPIFQVLFYLTLLQFGYFCCMYPCLWHVKLFMSLHVFEISLMITPESILTFFDMSEPKNLINGLYIYSCTFFIFQSTFTFSKYFYLYKALS